MQVRKHVNMKSKCRIFATSEAGIRNGSFMKVNYSPVRGVSWYVNGDYMGRPMELDIDGKRGQEAVRYLNDYATELVANGYKEYSWAEFKRLAPQEIF